MKTTLHRTALAIGAGLLVAGTALAQPAPGGGPNGGPNAGPGGGPRGERGTVRMFEMFDTNRDGRVTFEEAWVVMTERFNAADADRNGGLTPEQFAAMRMRPADAPAPRPERAERMAERRAAMFRALDADRNGQVTLEELRLVSEMRFRAADANGDGAVTREEVRSRGHHRGHQGGRGGQPGEATPPAGR
jgi:Ca2+-binding EF-hand superfamily protein